MPPRSPVDVRQKLQRPAALHRARHPIACLVVALLAAAGGKRMAFHDSWVRFLQQTDEAKAKASVADAAQQAADSAKMRQRNIDKPVRWGNGIMPTRPAPAPTSKGGRHGKP